MQIVLHYERKGKSFMQRIILSVIISTYNRSDLVIKNLHIMMKCKSERIEFIVGDNFSTDDTWEQLQKIDDKRVRIYHNDYNYGLANTALLTKYANGKYLIFITDRDYIRGDMLQKVCKELNKIEADFVCYDRKKYKEGYYSGKTASRIVMNSVHPGTYIWKTRVYRSCINYSEYAKLLLSDHASVGIIGLGERLVMHAETVYVIDRIIYIPPNNIVRLKPNRKELFSDLFITAEYCSKYFSMCVRALYSNDSTAKRDFLINDVLILEFERLQYTAMWEYYSFLSTQWFIKRYNCKKLKRSQWLLNGGIVLVEAAKHTIVKKQIMKYIWITVKNYVRTFYHIVYGSEL